MINYKYISQLNAISESGVLITEEEAKLLMQYAVKTQCRISQEKVKMIALNSGLTLFNGESKIEFP